MDYTNIDIDPKGLKRARFMGQTRRTMGLFPRQARKAAGFELAAVQRGDTPRDFKPMAGIGAGVFEIRIHVGTAYRVIYVAKFAEAVYVLHAFEKRTRKTSKHDLDVAKRHYAEMMEWRRHERQS
jgi:phage-related protein